MPKLSLPTDCNYWLFKSEPNVFSFDDLMGSKGKRTTWDGVRNYQARNLLRDEMKKGDGVLFYHSNAKPMVIAGIAKIVKAGYPDHFAYQEGHRYYDPKSDPDNPAWYMVDIQAICPLPEPITRDQLKAEKALAKMMLLARGSRLSVQPVRHAEWRHILEMAGLA